MPQIFYNDGEKVEETPEILMERTLDWNDPLIPISNFPYCIAIPIGSEAVNYTRTFNWYWTNLHQNRRVEIEQVKYQIHLGHGPKVEKPKISYPLSKP
ncbi:hypothetical protein MKX03_033359, partial [Papaver bracteatum]